jgi:hypothetical protein
LNDYLNHSQCIAAKSEIKAVQYFPVGSYINDKGEYLDPKTHMVMLESRQKQKEWIGSKRLSYRSSYRGNTSSGRRCNIIILAAVVKELRIQDIMVSRNFICERCRKAI